MNENASTASHSAHAIGLASLWMCVLATVGVGALDHFTQNLNLSILYSVPLVLYVLLSARPVPWWVVAVVIITIFAGYFTKPPDGSDPADWYGRLLHLRMVNRGLVAAVVVVISLLSVHFADLRRALDPAPRGTSVDTDDEVSRLLEHLLVMLACSILMAGIFISDFLTPPRINMPILYAVPVVLSLRSLSRRLLWRLTPFALLLPFVSYFWDIESIPSDRRMWSFINRLIAAGAVLIIALAMDYWMRTAKVNRAASEDPPSRRTHHAGG